MLNLANSGSTPVMVTLYELCTNIFNPYFTWVVTKKGSNDIITFCADDFSTAPYYWNRFTFSVATSSVVGLTQGLIPIYAGEWIYNVYETTNQYDLGLTTSQGLVEEGIIVVEGTFSTINAYTQTNIYKIPVYTGNS